MVVLTEAIEMLTTLTTCSPPKAPPPSPVLSHFDPVDSELADFGELQISTSVKEAVTPPKHKENNTEPLKAVRLIY
ncbi:hypothetical protein B9G98_00452 [Wickerhamiella sorbophila]|uniref:Uncharacterized protein n=1 Tax=Wickerhamiella sorbophila TaxID=45607 RepID=A0A2T0FCV0_9ASCO|nr:hypothetical protein B9G98_00452 [Wickerhamiella sorbophila]PRT52832.1 hypothetical protein B9G98_00452 [Wickerhamiella sorbophila]